MKQFPLYLHRAAVTVGAEPLGFVFFTHQGSAAVGAYRREIRQPGSRFAQGRLDGRNLGDYLPAFLDID